MEKVIETKICKCGTHFDITDKDLEFYERVSPIFGGKKYLIPTPSLCPDCRQQRRSSFRNEKNLYRRICDATGKNIISIYSPEKPYRVYDQNEWWSDKWNPLDFGQDYDFSRPFFDQFDELQKQVPKLSLINKGSENSEYTNDANYNKNCYLCFGVDKSEDCYYILLGASNKNCIDCHFINESENCYEISDCHKAYNCKFCQASDNISDCFGCIECFNTKNCFGCIGLNNKEYHIFNKQYLKEEYFKKIEEIKKSHSIKEILEKIDKLKNDSPRKYAQIFASENAVGDWIKNSENITDSYNIWFSKNMKYCYDTFDLSDCQDIYVVAYGASLIYESQTIIGKGIKSAFCNFISDGISNSYYVSESVGCTDCFGCIGLRNAKYCILNKQYTKEGYEALVPKIIEQMEKTGEWGEFFPSSISPFGYNETVASEYFPLDKNIAVSAGFRWSDYENPAPNVERIVPSSKLPEDITKIPDDILNWAIECEVTGKPFRITKQELDFYRLHELPLPKRHPDVRHMDRMKHRNPRKLYDRHCDKCEAPIKTTYAPDRKEIVYCGICYDNEII